MSSSKPIVIISDANVLIDYLKANEKLITEACSSIFEIYVPIPVLGEIKQLSETKAKKIGLRLYEPSMEQLIESSSGSQRLSYQDKLCLRIAKDNGWICATNDKVLKKECERSKVSTIWGLEIMLVLNEQGVLTKREAIKTAQSIFKENTRLGKAVVHGFIEKLK